jgi:glutamine synthetase
MLNTAVAQVLKEFADTLEKSTDFDKDLHEIIKDTIIKHKRIIFNGNGYDEAWVSEAKKRGLLNLASTPEALPYYIDPKNIKLFKDNNIYSDAEIHARYEIGQEHYCKVVNIEAKTAIDMTLKGYLPTISKYTYSLTKNIQMKKNLAIDTTYEEAELNVLSNGLRDAFVEVTSLKGALTHIPSKIEEASLYYRNKVLPKMESLRNIIDSLEEHVDKEVWPYPTYGDLLFGVR